MKGPRNFPQNVVNFGLMANKRLRSHCEFDPPSKSFHIFFINKEVAEQNWTKLCRVFGIEAYLNMDVKYGKSLLLIT